MLHDESKALFGRAFMRLFTSLINGVFDMASCGSGFFYAYIATTLLTWAILPSPIKLNVESEEATICGSSGCGSSDTRGAGAWRSPAKRT